MGIGTKLKVAMQDWVMAQMSNKAALYITEITGAAPQTWAELWNLGPGRYVWLQTVPLPWEPEDTPTGPTQVELTIHSKPDCQTALTSELRYTNGATSLCAYIGEQVSTAADGRWSGKIATATKPEEHALPLETGLSIDWTYENGYRIKQDFEISLYGAVYKSGTSDDIQNTETLLTLPAGLRPGRRAIGMARAARADGTAIVAEVWVETTGSVRLALPQSVSFSHAKFRISFYAASTDPIAQQSTPVRMLAPMSRMARSVTSKEPEKRLMCVVDAGGAYVEYVEVTVTYDEEWETLGALFAPYCYALKDGEALVDSDRPPHMRVHAGGDGLIAPVWDLGGKVWLEAATAEEIAAWELEHPDHGKAPEAVRAQRDMLLSATDKYAVLDAPISAETRAALYTYRQDLRNVPEQAGFPDAVIWPELPAITKAAPDPVDAAFDMMTGGEENA